VSKRISHQYAAAIGKALHEIPEEQQPAARALWDNVTLSKEAQRRLQEYLDLIQDCLEKAYVPLWRNLDKIRLCSWYGQEGRILRDFERWMDKMPVPLRKARKDLAIFRVLEPLFDAIEMGWMEVGFQDLVRKRNGHLDDRRLVRVLHLGIEREKILLNARGPDQERARRLAACAEAHTAYLRAAAHGEGGEEVRIAQRRRTAVYRENRIPQSYTLEMPVEGPSDTRLNEVSLTLDVEMGAEEV
jgi:hypothetical protein